MHSLCWGWRLIENYERKAIMLNELAFYQRHLDKVSRSFAFCIRELQSPFREWVSLSYILCRQLDTIEDAVWPDKGEQQKAFIDFESFLHNYPEKLLLSQWMQRFPANIPSGEKELIADSAEIFHKFHALPSELKSVLRGHVLFMSQGMQYFSKQAKFELRSLQEVNQYCFFVAGIVGALLTDLFCIYKKES